jgi:hypothetical protein
MPPIPLKPIYLAPDRVPSPIKRVSLALSAGQYLRRKNPVPQLDGVLFSLREQRSHFVET